MDAVNPSVTKAATPYRRFSVALKPNPPTLRELFGERRDDEREEDRRGVLEPPREELPDRGDRLEQEQKQQAEESTDYDGEHSAPDKHAGDFSPRLPPAALRVPD